MDVDKIAFTGSTEVGFQLFYLSFVVETFKLQQSWTENSRTIQCPEWSNMTFWILPFIKCHMMLLVLEFLLCFIYCLTVLQLSYSLVATRAARLVHICILKSSSTTIPSLYYLFLSWIFIYHGCFLFL